MVNRRNFLLAPALFCLVSSSSSVYAQNNFIITKRPIQICSSESATATSKESIPGWYPETREGDFEIDLDPAVKHSGVNSAYLKSVVPHPRDFGNLTNWFAADEYTGKRLKMSAWVKTNLTSGTAQLWLRVDGKWKSAAKEGCFDNMGDRPIKGGSDWTHYSLVVDVPEKSTDIVFGLMLLGTGQAWLDDVSFTAVGEDVPVTGEYGSTSVKRQKGSNLNFDDARSPSQRNKEVHVTQSKKPTKTKMDTQADIHEWYPEPTGQFEVGLDETQKHSGSRSAYIKSLVPKPSEFGQLSQAFVPNNYLGKRIKMSAWVKTKLTSGTANLWILVEGEWTSKFRPGCFDNMADRPITADTDWTEHSLVVDVPETSNHVRIGCILNGTGQVWVDDFSLRVVGKEVPLTGSSTVLQGCGKKEPVNMSFEENDSK